MNIDLSIISGKESESFERIAHDLINNYCLCVNDTPIELCDLEFYWNDLHKHSDETTHKHEYHNGQLRPHGSGYDIALRDGEKYGGILIRGIMANQNPEYGPLLSSDIVFKAGGNIISEGLSIKLTEKKPQTNYPVLASERIGLKPVKDNYHNKLYRFISCNLDYVIKCSSKEGLVAKMVQEKKLEKQKALDFLKYTPKALKEM